MCALCMLALVQPVCAAGREIHSNGRGGGLWSEPETWHGREIPGAEDTVVIAMRDRVEFDGDDRNRATCAALFLDPEAVLSFREGRSRRTLTVTGPIESYGTIRIDGTGDRRGIYELVLAAADPSKREIRLLENAALLSYGHEQHRSGERTVRIIARELDSDPDAPHDDVGEMGADSQVRVDGESEVETEAEEDSDDHVNAEVDRTPGRIIAEDEVMFDLNKTHVHDVHIELQGLDNTGATPRERLNVIGSYFTGASSLRLVRCDTPALRNNTFHTEQAVAPETALSVERSALAEIRDNAIEGPYETGIRVTEDTDTSLRQTRIAGAQRRGIYVADARNTSIKDVHIRETPTGLRIDEADMVLEAVVVELAGRSFHISRSSVQLTDCSALNPLVDKPDKPESDDTDEGEGEGGQEQWEPPVAQIIHLDRASVRLINSPIESDEITYTGDTPGGAPYVETMQYVIVQVWPDAEIAASGAASDPGEAVGRLAGLPRGLQVRIQTAEESGGVPEGRADLNVRNSPVPVSETGLTPLPRSQRALAVRSWRIDSGGEFRQAPFYDLIVEKRSENADQDLSYETLVQRKVEPRANWFRPEPNSFEPTIEVILP